MLKHGVIPLGLCVLHLCDCCLCVRPGHLRLGTQRENIDDMVNKGRSLIGERNNKAKVTDEQVIEIRALYHSGQFTQASLAQRFGLKQPQVSSIILRQSWKHLAESAP